MKALFYIFLAAVLASLSPNGALQHAEAADAPRGAIASQAPLVHGMDFSQTIDTWGSPQRGPSDAPVTIAVFSDFQ